MFYISGHLLNKYTPQLFSTMIFLSCMRCTVFITQFQTANILKDIDFYSVLLKTNYETKRIL